MFKSLSLQPVLLSLWFMIMSSTMYLSLGMVHTMKEIMIEWYIMTETSTVMSFVIIIDFISILFLNVVMFVASSVIMFSISYMSSDTNSHRFHMILLLFIISMFLLITSPNMISIILGWDGLGVTSYLLVMYYQNNKSYNASMLTALTNRLGDVGLLCLMGILLISGSWNNFLYSYTTKPYFMAISSLVIITSMTKSAQIPFSSWLPAAMAAPTPVSALVHSSTLVTAGVYLLIRFNAFMNSSQTSNLVLIVGILTMLMAGMSAMMEMDMKKIIALSTLSQLGVMFMTLGTNMKLMTFVHLLSHAYFKAMLFISAGIMIHNYNSLQDLRMMGMASHSSPLVLSGCIMANMSLCGLPFMSGFYSKDSILEMMFMSSMNMFMFYLILIGTALTAMYSIRFLIMTFHYTNLSSHTLYSMDTDFLSNTGMLMLWPLALCGGYNLFSMLLNSSSLIMLPNWMRLSILLLVTLSLMMMTLMSKYTFNWWYKNTMAWMTSSMLFMPFLYSEMLSTLSMKFPLNYNKLTEKTWMENITMNFMKMVSFYKNKLFLQNYSSLLSSYILFFLIIMFIFFY